MSARRQIITALSRDSVGVIATLADVEHAEQLVTAHRAEVLNKAADEMDAHCEKHGVFGVGDRLRRMAKKATPQEATATPELTIYRAEYDSIPFGLYTTAAAAREHCEALVRREMPDHNLDWIEDEEDGVAELTVWVGGEETTTGYVVTALEVASKYDEEADE